MAIEAWINFLLSGPQTHAVNVLSNTLTIGWAIPEHMLAAGIGKLHGGEKILGKEVAARAAAVGPGLLSGARRGLKALVTGEPSDVLSKIETSKYRAIPGKLGSVIRTPGRLLTAEDEFFKGISYDMELYAQATRKAASEGLKGRELAKKVQAYIANPTEEMVQKSTYNAQYKTFTKPLGSFGKNIQSLSNSHPLAKLILPFIRTPVNIVKFAGERTPLALFSKEVKAILGGRDGAAARDLQLARLGMGTAVSAMAYNLASEGKITGGGPTDPKEKAAMYLTGWQPYSVKIGDKYYSYGRLEPLGILLGYAADAANIAKKTNKAEAGELGALILASVTKNLTNKTFLKGISDLVEAYTDAERYGDSWIKNYAGTVVPTGVAQWARVEDPILRQTNTVLEKIRSRIPYYSKDLLPIRDLYGDPIKFEGGLGPDIVSPVYVSSKENNYLSDEMVRLKFFPTLPSKQIGSVELTPKQYDELSVSAGKKLKKALDMFTSSIDYQFLPDQVKIDTMKEIVTKTRKAAREELQIKYIDIATENMMNKVNKYREPNAN